MPFSFIILVDCSRNANFFHLSFVPLQAKIYVDNEANLTLHGFVQVLFLLQSVYSFLQFLSCCL
jgi:hypothetical protein